MKTDSFFTFSKLPANTVNPIVKFEQFKNAVVATPNFPFKIELALPTFKNVKKKDRNGRPQVGVTAKIKKNYSVQVDISEIARNARAALGAQQSDPKAQNQVKVPHFLAASSPSFPIFQSADQNQSSPPLTTSKK
jgi:hypothetical protein